MNYCIVKSLLYIFKPNDAYILAHLRIQSNIRLLYILCNTEDAADHHIETKNDIILL